MLNGASSTASARVSISQAALAGRVRDDVRPSEVGRERADVDDLAAAPRLHAGQRRARDEERPVEVRRLQLAPLLGRELLERLAAVDRGVVDEDVDRRRASRSMSAIARSTAPRRSRRRRRPTRGRRRGAAQRPRARASPRSRPLITTRAPARANPAAMASPRPEPPPVTTATRSGEIERRTMIGRRSRSSTRGFFHAGLARAGAGGVLANDFGKPQCTGAGIVTVRVDEVQLDEPLTAFAHRQRLQACRPSSSGRILSSGYQPYPKPCVAATIDVDILLTVQRCDASSVAFVARQQIAIRARPVAGGRAGRGWSVAARAGAADGWGSRPGSSRRRTSASAA